MFFQGQAPGTETLQLWNLQKRVCGQMQSWQPHVATQEHQAEALQVPALQQGLPQRGPPGAAHEISQVSSDERMSAELITIFSGASNHLFAMSVAFSSQWKVTGKGMLQSTVETGLWNVDKNVEWGFTFFSLQKLWVSSLSQEVLQELLSDWSSQGKTIKLKQKD